VAALDATDIVLAAAGDSRARRDLAAMRPRVRTHDVLPESEPQEPARMLAWAERRLAVAHASGAVLFPAGLPAGWAGSNFEVYGVPTGATSKVSFAVRWHGARPAVLWEQSGDSLSLSSPVLAPEWTTAHDKGEALWPQPAGLASPPTEGESFS